MAATSLFSPVTFKNLTLRNRIGVSPMCQYSSVEGFATDWHLVHIGSRAVGGAGLVIMEATAVVPEGRITPGCLGIWQDAHVEKLAQITAFTKSQGAAIGIQLAHAGRKASMELPWKPSRRVPDAEGGWTPMAPSAVPFYPDHTPPHEMTLADIAHVRKSFVDAALRAIKAGFQLIEIHGAHGYLLHEFLSPIANKRQDQYGGSFENRARLFIEIARDIAAAIPREIVLGARLSCTDWDERGWTLDDSVRLAKLLKAEGLDFIDCSSGAIAPDIKVPAAKGYQVPFAAEIRRKAGIATMAVGMITEPSHAQEIIDKGDADIVLLARGMLHDPYWPIHAAEALHGIADVPPQYLRGFDMTRFSGLLKRVS